jgi:hypothetical protein
MDHPFRADDIEMSVEHERRATGLSGTRNHIGPTRAVVHELYIETPVIQHKCENAGNLRLTWGARHERGIARVNSDEGPCQFQWITALHYLILLPGAGLSLGARSLECEEH